MLFCQVRRLVSLPSIGWGITAITKGSDEVLDRSDKTYTAKKSYVGDLSVPVSQTDTGRRGEYPQAREITHVKELGNLYP